MSGRPSWKSAEIGLFRKKAFFLRYPQIRLNPHLLNPHLRHSKQCSIALSCLGNRAISALSFLSFFFGIPCCFFPLRRIPCFFSVFPFFSRDFRGSAGIKKSLFFLGAVFLSIFPKKNKGKERVGSAMGIAIAKKNRCDFGALRGLAKGGALVATLKTLTTLIN